MRRNQWLRQFPKLAVRVDNALRACLLAVAAAKIPAMKPLLLIVVSFLLFQFSLRADLIIVQDVESTSPRMQMTNRITIKIKGNKTRIDSGLNQSVISDRASGEEIVLLHSQKQYMLRSASQTKEAMEMARKFMPGAGESSGKAPQLRETGRKEKISGYDAEQFVWEGPWGKGSYWVAKDFPNYEAILTSMADVFRDMPGFAQGMFPEPKGLPGMILRTELEQRIKLPPGLTPEQLRQSGLSQGLTVKTISTVVSVKEEALSDSEFATPPGYTPYGASATAGSPEGLGGVLKAMQHKGLSEADSQKLEQVIKDVDAQQHTNQPNQGSAGP